MLRPLMAISLVFGLASCASHPTKPVPADMHPTYVAFFGTNTADLTPDSYAIVQRAAEAIRSVKPQAVEVVGFTDKVGSEAADHNIADHRVNVVQKTLIDLGVAAGIITALPLGQPMDELGPTANRRVEIHLIKDYSQPGVK